MNSDKSTKEVLLQQLKSLSKRYEELLENFDETEHSIQRPAKHKRSWTTIFKKDVKKRQNNTTQ